MTDQVLNEQNPASSNSAPTQNTTEPNKAPETTQSAPATTIAPKSWIDEVPEDLRAEASVQLFKDKPVSELVKSYVSAQKEFGSRVRIPGPDASDEAKAEFAKRIESVPGFAKLPDPNKPEEISAFYEKLGRPKAPTEYQIKPDENVPVDKAIMGEFQNLAFNLGLNSKQAEALVKFEQSKIANGIQQAQRQKAETQQLLKQTWGKDYESRLGAAQNLVQHYAEKYPNAAADLVKEIAGPNLGNNPIVLMMAAELGKKMTEGGLIQGDRKLNFGLTPEEAREQAKEIMANKAHPYHNDMAPGHKEAVEKMTALYQHMYPEEDKS